LRRRREKDEHGVICAKFTLREKINGKNIKGKGKTDVYQQSTDAETPSQSFLRPLKARATEKMGIPARRHLRGKRGEDRRRRRSEVILRKTLVWKGAPLFYTQSRRGTPLEKILEERSSKSLGQVVSPERGNNDVETAVRRRKGRVFCKTGFRGLPSSTQQRRTETRGGNG